MNNWVLGVGDCENLIKSSKVWGINSPISANKHFLNNVRLGDSIWFVEKNNIIAVSKYMSHDERGFGTIINVSMSNKEVRHQIQFINDKKDNCNELCELLIINICEET